MPRVQITYDFEAGGAIESRELPFVIGVLGEFSGNQPRPPLRDRAFINIDFDNFDHVMDGLSPHARFSIPSSPAGEQELDLVFRGMVDFEPESLINRIDALRQLGQSTDGDAQAALARYLDNILHAPEFQAVESAWRGLWYLVSGTETSAQLQIKLFDVSKRELLRDLQKSAQFDQSGLFKAVYENPYAHTGEAPFGLLIGNFSFGTAAEDVELLERLAAVASCALAPFVAAAGPEMFGLDDFKGLAQVRDWAKLFDSAESARWRGFRECEDARYVALTLPRILLRSPYGVRPGTPDEFKYEEDTGDDRYLLWGNAAFAFGACVANAFTRYGWCGAIRGFEGGGLVEGLPTWVADNEETNNGRFSVEVLINDRREKEMTDAGFLPVLQVLHSDFAVFFTAISCAKPRRFDNDLAYANSRMSCQLQYILTASRFMHYLKVMARDQIGSYVMRSDLEQMFNRWISQYICLDDQASPAIRARLPLREARVDVLEQAGQPGTYRIVLFVRPYFQLDELSISLRLVGSIGSR